VATDAVCTHLPHPLRVTSVWVKLDYHVGTITAPVRAVLYEGLFSFLDIVILTVAFSATTETWYNSRMPHKITSPTGVTATVPLSEKQVSELKKDDYFKLEPQSNSLDDFFANEKPVVRLHRAPLEPCEACSA